ncbi:dihydrofolate reductase [Myceligenerans pegani]|uniref:Dihydrofolate reductase n=1 Tax=Myceligenerans pegani TaxID=2776917 RepID=A0ABR9MV33_9MICO|nr:dihydrofolate reductase [Myceligenerans sp. TRM 65318]MBE1875247.1 dihydrofolate reductase [Myceligenerans sp. TRM 65318]MBE3017518.1 dihydrofolate reductase [Myceligenerans sp. TRM 65318]
MIGLIWAQARDAAGRPVIGADNAIPWRIPEDFGRFKAITSGHPVVMGRLTWESLPKRPLPRRTNVVITSLGAVIGMATVPTHGEGSTTPPTMVEVAGSLQEALALAADAPGGDETWVMGGARLYAEAIDVADRLEVTEVDLEVEGDTFAPPIDPETWQPASTPDWTTSASGVRFRHLTYLHL